MKLSSNKPVFWRLDRMPYVELRRIHDASEVSYGRHSHKEWSIGAITAGNSTYLNQRANYAISAGMLVLMNPDQMHACNPVDGEPWSYTMLYIDPVWLSSLRCELGLQDDLQWRDFSVDVLDNPAHFAAFVELCDVLCSPDTSLLHKQSKFVGYFSRLLPELVLNTQTATVKNVSNKTRLVAVARFIDDNFCEAISLEQLCEIAQCGSSYLIRTFKQHTGFSPHAYLVNRRIQYAQNELKLGGQIADVALRAGFADQAHFQRVFKKHVAATPRQYR